MSASPTAASGNTTIDFDKAYTQLFDLLTSDKDDLTGPTPPSPPCSPANSLTWQHPASPMTSAHFAAALLCHGAGVAAVNPYYYKLPLQLAWAGRLMRLLLDVLFRIFVADDDRHDLQDDDRIASGW